MVPPDEQSDLWSAFVAPKPIRQILGRGIVVAHQVLGLDAVVRAVVEPDRDDPVLVDPGRPQVQQRRVRVPRAVTAHVLSQQLGCRAQRVQREVLLDDGEGVQRVAEPVADVQRGGIAYMAHIGGFVAGLLATAVTAVTAFPAFAEELTGDTERLSYTIGMDIGQSLADQNMELNLDLLLRAIRDTYEGDETLLTLEEAQAERDAFLQRRQQELHEVAGRVGEAKLGKDHPDNALILNNLGLTYLAMQQFAKAEPLLAAGVVIGRNEDMFIPKGQTLNGVAADETLFWNVYYVKGAFLNADADFDVLQGLRTLEVRMLAKCINTEILAHFLAAHPAIKVHCNVLPDNENHALREKLLSYGLPAPLFTIDLAGVPRRAFQRFFDNLSPTFGHMISLGQPNTIVSCPALTTHSELDEKALREAGITPTTIRFAVGDEDPRDLIAHLVATSRLAIDRDVPGFSKEFPSQAAADELIREATLERAGARLTFRGAMIDRRRLFWVGSTRTRPSRSA